MRLVEDLVFKFQKRLYNEYKKSINFLSETRPVLQTTAYDHNVNSSNS